MSPFAIDRCNFSPDVLHDGGQIVATAAKMAIDIKLCQIAFSAESLAESPLRMRIALPAAEG
jgi:hypothetical protein